LDEADEEEPEKRNVTAEELKEKIEAMKKRRTKAQEMAKELADRGETQISLTDPDSRSMPLGGGRKTQVAYSVQVSVDAKHKLIADHEVTNAVTDRDLLSQMAIRAKEMLEVEHLEALADMGYYHGKEVKRCVEEGITPYIPKASTSANRKLGLYSKEDFRYDSEQDCYGCPAGETLTYRFQTTEKGREIKYYATSACGRCALKPKCTRNKEGRRITRWVDEDLLDEMEHRVRADPEKMKMRKCLAEHPFGTIKHHMDQGFFLMKGLENVNAEMSLSVLAYNFKRVINILGVPEMMVALI